jgi:hypothetical protein
MQQNYTLIFRVEIDTLFDDNGKLSLQKMEHLVMIVTNLRNAGFRVLIVTSGAIMLGTAKMGLPEPPTELITKQAIAAIGQADLIKYYQMFFDSFDQMVAQVLITRDVADNPERKKNARNTLKNLLERDIIPIINENDSVSTDDIILNDNYPLTLVVARLIRPNAIIVKKKQKENRFMLVVRNNPFQAEVSEEVLFQLAHKIKAGKDIAREINFNCATRKPVNQQKIIENAPEYRLDIEMINGFPEILTTSYQES